MKMGKSPQTLLWKRCFWVVLPVCTVFAFVLYAKIKHIPHPIPSIIRTESNLRNKLKKALTTILDISKTKIRTEHRILVFNPAGWIKMFVSRSFLSDKCQFRNCRIVSNQTNLQNHSAIIFMLNNAPALSLQPPLSPSERNPDQAWIFTWLEAPINHYGIRKIYQNEHWRNTVNWTMTFTHDSDIYLPYGRLIKQTPPDKNYTDIFRRKSKMAAWIVSNCITSSQREDYMKEMRRHGVSVDVYGACRSKIVDRDEIRRNISRNYKFYLSFENSICKDYITEKFFAYFPLDVVLVVRGGGNYNDILSNDSYINTADFTSVRELASYLLAVASNEERYTSYLKAKDRFAPMPKVEVIDMGLCEICKKLNTLSDNRRIYKDLVDRVHNGTCFLPNDIW